MSEFFAHSAAFPGGPKHLLKDHINGVTNMAVEFAGHFGMANEAVVAGILHDLGKYGVLFQDRLENPNIVKGIDHWTAGAWVAHKQHHPNGVAAAIEVHHVGLQSGARAALDQLDPVRFEQSGVRLSEVDINVLLKRLSSDGVQLPEVLEISDPRKGAERMLRTGMRRS